MAMNDVGCSDTARVLRISNTVLRLASHQVAQNVVPVAEVVIYCEADEQRNESAVKVYAYDRIRKRVIAHILADEIR